MFGLEGLDVGILQELLHKLNSFTLRLHVDGLLLVLLALVFGFHIPLQRKHDGELAADTSGANQLGLSCSLSCPLQTYPSVVQQLFHSFPLHLRLELLQSLHESESTRANRRRVEKETFLSWLWLGREVDSPSWRFVASL
jgi:hypothetical protein